MNKYEFARAIGDLNIAIHPNSDDKHNYISYYVSNFSKTGRRSRSFQITAAFATNFNGRRKMLLISVS